MPKYISELPEYVKQIAILRRQEQPDYMYKKSENEEDVLDIAFDWSRTIEGHIAWYDIKNFDDYDLFNEIHEKFNL